MLTLLLLIACGDGDDTAAEKTSLTWYTEEIPCRESDHQASWYPPEGVVMVQAFLLDPEVGREPIAVGWLNSPEEYPFWCQYQGHSGTEYGDSIVVTWAEAD